MNISKICLKKRMAFLKTKMKMKTNMKILRKITENRLRRIAQSLDVSDYINSAACSMQIEDYYFNGLRICKDNNSLINRRYMSAAEIIELRLSPDSNWYWA
uniref:Uncharacterized protein n=1 Tax=Tupiella akineta TaxID=160070 RepID=Q3ZJ50_TUPAK|nr:hypothetical protein PsakCp043 [Tupiella akineta]AAV80641.1 hypothetical protein [Tupiella akineta]